MCSLIRSCQRYGNFKRLAKRSIQPTISRQPLQPTFAAKPAFFVTAKRTCWIELVVGVRPDDAGAQLVDHLENLAALVRPHARAQAVGNVVRALERLLRRAERHHAQHRPENFLRRHAMRVRDAREKRLRDNSVENSVKHFQFHANWRKLFGELGQICLTKTVLALNQNLHERIHNVTDWL